MKNRQWSWRRRRLTLCATVDRLALSTVDRPHGKRLPPRFVEFESEDELNQQHLLIELTVDLFRVRVVIVIPVLGFAPLFPGILYPFRAPKIRRSGMRTGFPSSACPLFHGARIKMTHSVPRGGSSALPKAMFASLSKDAQDNAQFGSRVRAISHEKGTTKVWINDKELAREYSAVVSTIPPSCLSFMDPTGVDIHDDYTQ